MPSAAKVRTDKLDRQWQADQFKQYMEVQLSTQLESLRALGNSKLVIDIYAHADMYQTLLEKFCVKHNVRLEVITTPLPVQYCEHDPTEVEFDACTRYDFVIHLQEPNAKRRADRPKTRRSRTDAKPLPVVDSNKGKAGRKWASNKPDKPRRTNKWKCRRVDKVGKHSVQSSAGRRRNADHKQKPGAREGSVKAKKR